MRAILRSGFLTLAILTAATPAYSESCQIADILFGQISLDIIPYDGYETAVVRSATFDNPEKYFGAILGEITVDRGAFAVRTTGHVVVGVITPQLHIEGWDDVCDKKSNVEIVKVRDGSYTILSDNDPVGTISGRFPDNGFGVQ